MVGGGDGSWFVVVVGWWVVSGWWSEVGDGERVGRMI